MPYKDPEKAKESGRERSATYRERHPERSRGNSLAWYKRNPEKAKELHRRWYEKNKERIREYNRKRRAEHPMTPEQKARQAEYKKAWKERQKAAKEAAKNGQAVAAAVAAAVEERSDEMGLKVEKCPLCQSAASAKLKGVVYLAGCLNKKCRKWIDGDESETGATMAGAIGNWNKWVEEERRAQEAEEEAERIAAELEKQDAENGQPAPEDPDEDLDADLPGELPEDAPDDLPEDEGESDEPDEPEEPEEPEDGGEPESGEGEEDGEDDGETFARFWLELDGTWYWMDGREDEDSPCEGCAFCLAFGRRTFCAAASSEDFSEASELCKRLEGVWKKNEE
jgi:cobalamin biosynthesis protein CobT